MYMKDYKVLLRVGQAPSNSTLRLFTHLFDVRRVSVKIVDDPSVPLSLSGSLIDQILIVAQALETIGGDREAQSLRQVSSLSLASPNFGGLGLSTPDHLDEKSENQILFLVLAWLEALNSEDRSMVIAPTLTSRPLTRRAMTLSEKIFAFHDVDNRGELKPGDMVRVRVDWVMASEMSWKGMRRTYNSLGKPGIFRNDRFWLAGDHVVDPRNKDDKIINSLIVNCEEARDELKMTEYQGTNYTIMHTEFTRERAQPGMIVIGADSHTCSAGSLGCLAIGLGASDATIPLITGEAWFKVPETVNIRLVGTPDLGIGGKDIILYILSQLKRNTVAADKVVEFTGPGLQYLSCDARFAIANMTTEFGGITGIFVPDQITADYINKRPLRRNKKESVYFMPDDGANYSSTHIIDLAHVESFIAQYPSPDNVVPVTETEGTPLDGCFIGACTTTREDLILAALVLELGLSKGLVPVASGKRKVVPGSLPILHELEQSGYADIYRRAGFEVGIPGCSYCVGMSVDKAGEGEVWLSSQNRNFENRMGKGSIGHLSSAVTVAASSFEMRITNPKSLIDEVDMSRLNKRVTRSSTTRGAQLVSYVEPGGVLTPSVGTAIDHGSISTAQDEEVKLPDVLEARIQRLGDFVDTDAIIPAEVIASCTTDEDFGEHCLKHTNPDFRARVQEGHSIVVAGKAFGCGSSRQEAVHALIGIGVKCVIAQSFAFIYNRNQSNLGLLGISITDPEFYTAASDGADIKVDIEQRMVMIKERVWQFEMTQMERELIRNGGLNGAWKNFGKKLFEVMGTDKGDIHRKPRARADKSCTSNEGLQW